MLGVTKNRIATNLDTFGHCALCVDHAGQAFPWSAVTDELAALDATLTLLDSLGHRVDEAAFAPIDERTGNAIGTLINGLQWEDKTYGLESMCVGGGQGMAMIVERLS